MIKWRLPPMEISHFPVVPALVPGRLLDMGRTISVQPIARCLLLLTGLFGFAACSNCDEQFSTLVPSMQAEPEEVVLNAAPVTQDTFFDVNIFNSSQVDLRMDSVSLSDDSDPAFEIVFAPTEVSAGAREPVHLRVRPVVIGEIKATLILEGEEEADPNYLEVPIRVEALDLGVPDIEVTPEEVSFDQIGEGDVVRATVTIANVGVRDLVIDETRLEPAEEGDDAIRLAVPVQPGWAITPGQTVSVDLVFAPLDTVEHLATLFIESNDPNEGLVSVPIQGIGSVCPVAVVELLDDPDEIEPLDTVRLDGRNSYTETEGAEIVSYEWVLEQRPVGSTTILSTPTNERTEIDCDIAGDYQVRLQVWDDRGIRSCNDAVVRFTAQPKEDLHIQLVWDHPTADLDLHLLREGGMPFTHEGDTYFSNRLPQWFPDNPESNPSLDVDDNEGYGPENINIETPLPGSTWTILAHYWNKQTDGDPYTVASLRIYARGQEVADISESLETDEVMWTVAEIQWPESDDEMPTITQIGLIESYPRPF